VCAAWLQVFGSVFFVTVSAGFSIAGCFDDGNTL